MPQPREPEFAILLKAPRAGSVKTRLARELGDTAAVDLYRLMVDSTLAAVRGTGWRTTIWYSPIDADREFENWLGREFRFRPQPAGDLGARMAAVGGGLAEGTPVIILGGDCPGITTDLLLKAGTLLASTDVVLGPSLDGGYYLLGARTPLPELFGGIEWSTPTVAAATRDRLLALGQEWIELDVLRDVDTVADARATGLLE